MPRATVGTFLAGQRLAGENSYQLGKPQLLLVARTFSVTVTNGGGDVVAFPNSPDLLLNAKPFTLTLSATVTMGKATLLLRSKTYTVAASQTVFFGSPVMQLQAKGYGFVISQSITVSASKPVLLLLGKAPRRVGEPWLLPTVPLTGFLTPSPAETGAILVPTVPVTELLIPTKVRVG